MAGACGTIGALLSALVLVALPGAAAAAEGQDVLPAAGRDWTQRDGVAVRRAGDALELRTGDGETWAALPLCEEAPQTFELELELRWTQRGDSPTSGVELAVGPHGFGSRGYRVVVEREPWRTVECRGPALAPGRWHRLTVRASARWVAYAVDGQEVLLAPGAGHGALALALGPGTEAAARRGRLVPVDDAEWPVVPGPRFTYPAPWFARDGRVAQDGEAGSGQAVELRGRGLDRPLLGGQDGTLPGAGHYAATFGLRAVAGAGRVRLAAARSGGRPVGVKTVSAAELPLGRYRAVTVPFRYEPGRPMEYTVAAAEDSTVRVDAVRVARAEDGPARRAADGLLGAHPRRPPALEQTWPARPMRRAGASLEIVRLERRLAPSGGYRLRVVWRQTAGQPVDGVGVDLWVSCRDDAGRVRVLDYGMAYERVAPGRHVTAAEISAERCERYGAPGSLLVQLYREGRPVASAWRKWGIPVEDKWILPAERVGRLGEPVAR
jgi:hypothetical protein